MPSKKVINICLLHFSQQKLLVGDDSGHMGCYEFKKGEPQVVFQLKLFEGPITCLSLAGNPMKRDKVTGHFHRNILQCLCSLSVL